MQSETRFLGSDIRPICELKLWCGWKVTSASRRSTQHWRSSLVPATPSSAGLQRTRDICDWRLNAPVFPCSNEADERVGETKMFNWKASNVSMDGTHEMRVCLHAFQPTFRRLVRWQAETIWHISVLSLKRTSPRYIGGVPPCVKKSVSHASMTVLHHPMKTDMKTSCKVENYLKLWMLCVWAVMEVIIALASHVQHGMETAFVSLDLLHLPRSHGRIIYHSQRNPILVFSFAGFYFAVSPFHHRRLDYFFVSVCLAKSTFVLNEKPFSRTPDGILFISSFTASTTSLCKGLKVNPFHARAFELNCFDWYFFNSPFRGVCESDVHVLLHFLIK